MSSQENLWFLTVREVPKDRTQQVSININATASHSKITSCSSSLKRMKATFVNLRVFSHQNKSEHSYYVAHEAGGLSPPMDSIAIDPNDSFLKTRELIEEQSCGNVMSRRRFYAEFLQFMQRCPNPLSYDGEHLSTYRFGVLKTSKEKGSVPSVTDIKVIRASDEASGVRDVVGELVCLEFVLIPTTQIHPFTDRLCDQL